MFKKDKNDKKAKKRPGFTLLEMIIVVAIIGVLVSIVAVKYGQAQKKAKENADYASAANIATATEMAISDGVDISSGYDVENLVKSGYLSSSPKVQSMGNSGEGKTKFEIEYNDDGESNHDITVKANNKVFYPKEKKQ